MVNISVLDAVKGTIFPKTVVKLTGIAPIDKVIIAVVGSVGMAAVGLIAAVGLYKVPPLSTLSASKGYGTARKMLKGTKLLWDSVEPILRNWKPTLKEQFHYVDQTFDFIQNFMDTKEIGSLFRSDDRY